MMDPLEAVAGPDELDTEVELLERCRRGDEGAAEWLVATHSPMVYRIGLRLTGRVEDAEDLTQEVFLRVFRSLAEFRHDCSLKSWIAAVAVNAVRNRIGKIVRFRKLFTSPSTVEDPEEDPMQRFPDDAEKGPERRVLAGERRRFLIEAIRELPREFREAVVLRDQEGLSYDEIASTLGVPVGTVRSRLARGRALLARRLEGLAGGVS